MKRPEDDLTNRQIAWDAMHVIWLDTALEPFYLDAAAEKCAATRYSTEELEHIYWTEVYLTMRKNLWDVAGEWAPLDIDDLSTAVLKNHKFGRRVWMKRTRGYAFENWQILRSKIENLRAR